VSYNYREDCYGKICLEYAVQCKTDVGFGAVLVKDGEIIGYGRNRQATKEERKFLKGVDYAVHAEEACIIDVLRKTGCFDKNQNERSKVLDGAEIFVLGLALRGPLKGRLTSRRDRVFVCVRCTRNVLIPFNVPVNIPRFSGWAQLTPQEAVVTSKRLCGNGYWKKFTKKKTV